MAAASLVLIALAAAASSNAEVSRAAQPEIASRANAGSALPVGARSGKLLVQVTLNAAGHGKFSARGVVSDQGTALGDPRISPKRVRLRITFAGVGGTFRIAVRQLCGSARSTWKIVSGSQAYRGLSGHGTGKGRIPCGRGASRLSLSGTAKRPILPLALPGTYRGTRPSQNLRATFDVVATGSAITNVSFAQLVARCSDSRILFLKPKFNANYPIGADKRFSIAENGFRVIGSFSSQSAQGTISYDSGGCHTDPVAWSATTPPPPLPVVRTGRYCGFTLQGPGICVDAVPGGWAASARTTANVRCDSPEKTVLTVSYDFEGLIVLASDLSFRTALTKIPLDGGGSISWKISGKFDNNGGAAGNVAFSNVSLFHNGKLYTCRNSSSSWTAQLGR